MNIRFIKNDVLIECFLLWQWHGHGHGQAMAMAHETKQGLTKTRFDVGFAETSAGMPTDKKRKRKGTAKKIASLRETARIL